MISAFGNGRPSYRRLIEQSGFTHQHRLILPAFAALLVMPVIFVQVIHSDGGLRWAQR